MKTEREMELINEQVLMAMCEMGLDRERTLQVAKSSLPFCLFVKINSTAYECLAFSSSVSTNRCI